MKTKLMLTLVASLCLVALPSCDKKEEAKAPEAAAAPAKPTDHAGVAKAMMTTCDKMIPLLASVTDKASADAAAPKIEPLAKEMKELMALGDKLGEPSPEAMEGLKSVQEAFDAKFGELVNKIMPLAMEKYYGSEALQKVLESVN